MPQPIDTSNPDTATAETKMNPFSLRFSSQDNPQIEQAFRDAYFEKNLNHLRYCHFVSIFFYVVAGVIDYLIFHEDIVTLFIIRFLVVVPIFIIGYLFTYSRFYRVFWQGISFFYILLTGSSFIVFTMIARPPEAYDYYVGTLFCMIFGYTFIRERFIYASAAGLMLSSGYLLTSTAIVNMPPQFQFHSNFYLFLMNFLGMIISRYIEISARRDFLLEHRLSIEKQKVLDLNDELEQRVQERTTELQKEISERKHSDKVLTESERRYRELFQNNPACCFTFDRQGVIRDWNRACEALYGWHNEQVIGRSMFDLMVQKKNSARTAENIKRLFEGQVLEGIEFEDVKADGSLCHLLVSEYPIADHHGNIVYGLCAELDITDRKRAEEAFRESEKKYRNVLETSPDPIIVYDMEGRVTYFNHAFTRVFGWSLEECVGKTMDIFVPDDAWPETQEMIEKVKAGQDFAGFETRRYTRNGEIIHVTISGAVNKDNSGRPIGSVANIKDISARIKLEAQLQRAQKMEALGILAGGVAHDINNVLSGIVSYPDLLLMQIPEGSPLRDPILTIQESGKRAADIVQDLLTLARRGVVIEDVVNLNEVITDYLQKPQFEKLKSWHPRVEIETRLSSDLFNIVGSRLHLSKAVMNLAVNAVEAMPDGGKITIATENRYIDKQQSGYDNIKEGDYVTLTVSDTGIGIPPEDKERIFEPFYTKKIMGRSGTGLGMAVVWGTVKDHNGAIDVQSNVGIGTTFTLYFPASRQQKPRSDAHTPFESYQGHGETILVVDDQPFQREIAASLLTSLGYVVAVTASGEEAVEYTRQTPVDLMVLDMIMDPGIDGMETYRRIIEIRPGQKAIIASGYAETERVKKAQQMGAGTYLKKPYTLEKLGVAIREELDK